MVGAFNQPCVPPEPLSVDVPMSKRFKPTALVVFAPAFVSVANVDGVSLLQLTEVPSQCND